MGRLVGLVGYPGSGKSTIANTLRHEHGFTAVSGSSILKDSFEDDPLGRDRLITREDYGKFHVVWRKRNGLDAMGREVARLARTQNVCFENVRNRYDAGFILQAGGIIATVLCPADVRYERILKRGDSKDGASRASFDRLDALQDDPQNAYGLHTGLVIALSNVALDGMLEPAENAKRFVKLLG